MKRDEYIKELKALYETAKKQGDIPAAIELLALIIREGD